ncbi:hypothetical protein JW921_09040 [Candidatus Fermentibacterales bacterium]|nr:hypothetical protein [Candidatus Fermentibacterales bacterium]
MLLLLILSVTCFAPEDPHGAGLGVPPCSWGRGCLSAIQAPPSLVRLERGQACLLFSEMPGAGWLTGCAAGKSWEKLSIGLHAVRYEDREDGGGASRLSGGLTIARVITGSPYGFIEEFFGPSLAVGLGIRASTWEDDSTGERATGFDLDCGLQFSVFPTFALGFSALQVASLADSTADAVYNYGASYVFNRDLTGHVAWTSGGTGLSAGADLKISDALRVRAGTDGETLSCGAGLRHGDLELDYGLDLSDDNTALHSVSLTVSFGERRSFR